MYGERKGRLEDGPFPLQKCHDYFFTFLVINYSYSLFI
jgi:hypothetical protein